MAKKKKLTKAERREARLRKGKQWLLTYTCSPKKMNKHYWERFHVDAVTAAKDLQELGAIIHRSSSTRLNRLKNSGFGSGEWSGKRKNGNGWQNCMRTAMVILLLSPDIQMAAHRMV